MIEIRASEQMPGSAEAVWALLTDWAAHSRWVPATTVTVLEDAGGVGTRFVGRSHAGPLGFDDPMTVTEYEPPSDAGPGRCGIRKTGRIVTGTAGFTVTATGADTCCVLWWEDVAIAPVALTRWVDPLVARVGSRAFARVLRTAAADLSRR